MITYPFLSNFCFPGATGILFFPVAFCHQRFSLIISIELTISTTCSFRFIFLNWKHYSWSPSFLLPGWKSCPSSSWTFLHSHPEFLFSSHLGSGFFLLHLLFPWTHVFLLLVLSLRKSIQEFLFFESCVKISLFYLTDAWFG